MTQQNEQMQIQNNWQDNEQQQINSNNLATNNDVEVNAIIHEQN
jgi:hypothetical protein